MRNCGAVTGNRQALSFCPSPSFRTRVWVMGEGNNGDKCHRYVWGTAPCYQRVSRCDVLCTYGGGEGKGVTREVFEATSNAQQHPSPPGRLVFDRQIARNTELKS